MVQISGYQGQIAGARGHNQNVLLIFIVSLACKMQKNYGKFHCRTTHCSRRQLMMAWRSHSRHHLYILLLLNVCNLSCKQSFFIFYLCLLTFFSGSNSKVAQTERVAFCWSFCGFAAWRWTCRKSAKNNCCKYDNANTILPFNFHFVQKLLKVITKREFEIRCWKI